MTDRTQSVDQAAPGARLGLPVAGPGSVAGIGRRLGGLVVDLVLAGLVALLFTGVPRPGDPPWSTLVFLVMYLFFTGFFGQTPGMFVTRLRVRRVGAPVPPVFWRAMVRALLLCLVVPALFTDSDRRGLHDKAGDAVVVSA